ncbi:MAG: acyl carrier protein [Treponema sp.]|nr:acyl carrier protein [Treponema sp.]
MFETVRKIMAKQLRIDESKVTMDAYIKKDLGADSLSILQLLMTLEDDYGIVIPDEELATFEKVSDIMSYLDKQQKK